MTDNPVAEVRRPRAGEIALRLAVPAFGLALTLAFLSMSADLRGPAGWYARILVVLIGVISGYSLVAELLRLRRPASPAPVVGQEPGEAEAEVVEDDGVEGSDPTDEPTPPGGVVRVVVLLGSIVAMILLTDILGFWVSTLIPVLTTLLIMGVRLRNAIIAAVLTVAAGYLVFQVLLQIRFTDGILGLL